MTPIPDALAALIARHFETRYGARDDRAHLETLASEAIVVIGERAIPRQALADDTRALLDAWAAIPTVREPRFLAPSLVSWRPEGDREGLARVELREAETGTPLTVSLGLVAEEDGWKVAWGALVEDPDAPFAHQRFLAHTEMASLRAVSASGPLSSLLEASWARRHWLPRQRLLALPEASFTCAGTGACCSHEMTIGLDENAARLVGATDWNALIPGLPEGPFVEALPEAASGLVSFKHRLTRDDAGRCRFLSADNRCTIHALAGRAVFKPCHVFPYRFAWSPDGVCVTTHSMCPTARVGRGLPLAAQEPDLRSRLQVADLLRAEKYFLQPAEEVEWETFRTIEGQLLTLLEGEAPLKQKLWVALRWLQARTRNAEAGVVPGWYDEAITTLGWLQRTAMRRFGALFDPCFKDLRGVEAGEGLLFEHELELTRFFRSLLFGKTATYPYGLVAGLNYLALVHHVLERQVATHARKGISEAFWREFYAVVVSGAFFRWLAVCHANPTTGLARHAGDPAFGLSLLRAY